jgi:hypothetical protein
VKLASQVAVDDGTGTKTFDADEFRRVQRASFFVGATSFWRGLEQYGPDPATRRHAQGILHLMAESSFADCDGRPYSPQQAECFEYLGFKPRGVRPPGSAARS